MRTRLLLATALVACAAPKPHPPRGPEVFSIEGRVENGPFRFGRDDLPALPRRSFEAVPPFGAPATRVRFEGVSVAALLSDAMDLQRDADLAVFHGQGGVAAPVPLPALRQLKPVLADRIGGQPTATWLAVAAPLQLAWPNVGEPGIDTDPRMRWWWVGGVTKVVIQSWTRTYGKALAVPVGADDRARLGASALATECIGCHRVRGVGGTRGPELEVVQDRDAFSTAMRQHLRKVSGMSGAPEVSPTTAGDIAEFLRVADLVKNEEDRELDLPPPPDEPLVPPAAPPPVVPPL